MADGGSEIINYIVDKRETSRANWAQVTANVNGQITNSSVEKLIEGHEYEFRVSAENKYGVGDPIVTDSVIARNPFGKILHVFSFFPHLEYLCVLFRYTHQIFCLLNIKVFPGLLILQSLQTSCAIR